MTNGKLADEEVFDNVSDSQLQDIIKLCEGNNGKAVLEKQGDDNWKVTCIYTGAAKPSS